MIRKKIKLILFIIILIFMIRIIFSNHSLEVTKIAGIDNFPESYKPYLRELKKNYPNWNFIAIYTDLNWETVIENENKFGVNLVPKSYSDRWKNTEAGKYNVEVDSGWVDSSRRAVEYAMDPRNFLNKVRIFQFENLSYDYTINYDIGVEKILYGTEFYNKEVEYLNSYRTIN